MKKRFALVTASVGSFAGAMLAWRFAAQRRSLPCPSWLPVILENPYMNTLAGAQVILDRIELAPGMKLLDAGCGPGRLTVPAAQRVGPTGAVVGLDIQPGMLARARQKVEALGLSNVRFIQAGIGDGKLESAAFDRALLITVLGEIPDRGAAFGEIFRALKPGGVLSVTEVLPDPHYQSRSAVRRLAAEAGFEEQRCFGNWLAFTLNFVKPEKTAPPKIAVPRWSGVSQTLLAPLYMRARESRRPDALLRDEKAIELVNRIDYDFSRFRGAGSGQIFAVQRMREIDRRVRTFLADHPRATVVDIGCGLDTRFDRVDDGQVTWYDLDLPEVIALRQQMLAESGRCRFVGCSALDFAWMDRIQHTAGQPLLFVAEGVFPYLEEQSLRRLVAGLCERFPGSELIFDSPPSVFVRFSRLNPILRATHTRLGWALAESTNVEQWRPGICLIDEWFYFDQPEPRLRWYRLLKWFTPISKSRIVQYRLGSAEGDSTHPGAAPVSAHI